MSTEQRDLTPEEKIADLYRLVNGLTNQISGLEDTIYYLREDVAGKVGGKHDHYQFNDLAREIRNTEYHTHREYADSRHTHDRWDMR